MATLRVWAQAHGPEAWVEIDGQRYEAIAGRSGAIAAADKREGDGKTPLGVFKVLYGMYRADRGLQPAGGLKWLPLTPAMGWCDSPHDPLYNQPCAAEYRGCVDERLWREDTAYDYILVIDHNTPAIAGLGSAVFVHVWHPGKTATAGCVALKKEDFLTVMAAGVDRIDIEAEKS